MFLTLACTLAGTLLVAVPAQRPALTLDTLVAGMAAYLAEYETKLSSVVAEERYDQTVQYYATTAGGARVSMGSGQWQRRRKLLSDYLLVKVSGLNGWQPFRDVMEVAGLVGIGQRRSRDTRADADVIHLGLQRAETRFDITQVLAIGELGERHADVLIPARETPRFVLAFISGDTRLELESRNIVHQLREHRAPGRHAEFCCRSARRAEND
jgi:hypothetical protein